MVALVPLQLCRLLWFQVVGAAAALCHQLLLLMTAGSPNEPRSEVTHLPRSGSMTQRLRLKHYCSSVDMILDFEAWWRAAAAASDMLEWKTESEHFFFFLPQGDFTFHLCKGYCFRYVVSLTPYQKVLLAVERAEFKTLIFKFTLLRAVAGYQPGNQELEPRIAKTAIWWRHLPQNSNDSQLAQ